MLVTLLRKDVRLVVPVLIAMTIFLVAPALIWTIVAWVDQRAWSQGRGLGGGLSHEPLKLTYAGLAFAGLCCATLAVPALVATIMARERRDRSAELLGSLPVERGLVLISKVIVTMGCIALAWGVALGVCAALLHDVEPAWHVSFYDTYWSEPMVFWVIPIAIMMTGVAWLFGALLRSETIAAAIALMSTAAAVYTIYLTLGWIREEQGRLWYWGPEDSWTFAGVLCTIGAIGFVSGTVIMLRRATP